MNWCWKFLFLLLWLLPFAIGLLAAALWQGLVFGWKSCHAFMDGIE